MAAEDRTGVSGARYRAGASQGEDLAPETEVLHCRGSEGLFLLLAFEGRAEDDNREGVEMNSIHLAVMIGGSCVGSVEVFEDGRRSFAPLRSASNAVSVPVFEDKIDLSNELDESLDYWAEGKRWSK